jgi:hypothetical protein
MTLAIVCLMLALLPAGCVDVGGFFNPEFLQQLGVQAKAASTPGEAPSLLVEVENRTGRPIEYLLSWRQADSEVEQLPGVLDVDGKDGLVLFCPVEELTLGDVSNTDATGAVVRLGNGGASDPLIEVEPFGVLLQEEINYDCGDSVTFAVQRSSATLSGYQIFAFIRRTGAQTGTGAP